MLYIFSRQKKKSNEKPNNILQHKKAQSLSFATKLCIYKNTVVVHLWYFHQRHFLSSSALTRKWWSETQIYGCQHSRLQAPCPSEQDIKCPFKANLALYACIKSLAISPKCLLYHLDSCKVFLSGTQGIFVDTTSRQAEMKPGLTLRLDTGTGIVARFSCVSGGWWELSCTQAALGVLNVSTQHHAETLERALGRDWARWASGSSGSLLRPAPRLVQTHSLW